MNKKDILRKLTNLRWFYLNKTGFFLKRQNNFKATLKFNVQCNKLTTNGTYG